MSVAMGVLFAQGRGRGSPRRARHFSLSRQRKVPQRKATRLPASLRCAAGNLRCPRPAGSCSNSRFASAQTVTSPCPLAALLLGADRRVVKIRTAGQPDSRTAGQPDSRTAKQPNSQTACHRLRPHSPRQPVRPWNRLCRATGSVPLGGRRAAPQGGAYFNQPRFRKYHIGPSALASISAST